MTANSYLMQRQADLLGIPVDVASVEESTALGIAGLAGFGAGALDSPLLVPPIRRVRRITPRSPNPSARRSGKRGFGSSLGASAL